MCPFRFSTDHRSLATDHWPLATALWNPYSAVTGNLTILVGVLFLQVLGLAVQVKRSADEQSTRLIRVWAVDLNNSFRTRAGLGAKRRQQSLA